MTIIRPEVTGRSSGLSAIQLPTLSALDLERHVSVPAAAEIKNVSVDTFRRHYSHLIKKVSPRRDAVKLRDLIQETA